jgi:hypothetical protein
VFSSPAPAIPPPPIAQSVANAAQAVSSAASAVSNAAATAASAVSNAVPNSQLRFGPDGRIQGLDGVLNQIFESLGKQVTPLVVDKVVPILQRDRELQKTVGAAAGRAAAQELKPYLFLMGAGLTGIALVMAYSSYKKYSK